jgi:trk system potassium uptake protein TrkH
LLLLIGIGSVLGVDWLFPLRGVLSLGLVLAITVLSIPWAVHVLREERQSSTASDAQVRALGSLPAKLVLIGLGGGFLIAKWLTLHYSGAAHPDYVGSSRTYTLALALVMALGVAGRGLRLARFLTVVSEHPARLMALSFGVTGVVGALLLSLPVSLETVQSVSLVDNLFMAFSAVCVTGLSVTNVSETYTLFGEVVLCALIQIGGLGIMVLSAAIAVVAGQRLRVKSSAVLAQMVDASSLASLRRTVIVICAYTFAIEAVGAFILHSQFRTYPEIVRLQGHDLAGPGSAIWAAIFHSVSAFCNAGFSNVHAGLVPFVGNPVLVLPVAVLVVLGGIGFPVLDELSGAVFAWLRRRRPPRLSLNTRVSLWTTGILLSMMTVAYFVLEWGASMRSLALTERLSASLFHSAVARTAGFNVIDVGAMLPATLVLTCMAMFIGASPGSTGGGIKTTTVATLYAAMRAELRARPPALFDRRLPEAMIRKAVGVVFLSLVIVAGGFFLLLLLESHPPLDLLFEITSAFSTTGLSTGITPELTVPGKILITSMMFIGRIGPLTLALAVSATAQERALELPQERLMIG